MTQTARERVSTHCWICHKPAKECGERSLQACELGELLESSAKLAKLAKAVAALKKLRDGPGNNMASWKLTWAHQFAEDALAAIAPKEDRTE